jgi:hypothetical protein
MIRLLAMMILAIFVSGCGCGYVLVRDGLSIHFDPPLTESGEYWLQVDGEVGGICSVQLPDLLDCDEGLTLLGTEEGVVEGLGVFGRTPAQLSLSISLEGNLLSTHNLQPDYEVTQPGGPNCGEQHAAEVVVDPGGG